MSISKDTLLEISRWCEIRTDNILFVWQGVLALREKTTNRIWLLKLKKGYKIENVLLTNCPQDITLTSNGYWTCAEVRGVFQSGRPGIDVFEFYYHCGSPAEGITLLTRAKRYAERLTRGQLDWQMVRLKADMDPFRIRTVEEKRQQENSWSLMLKHCKIPEFSITEADMLSYDYQ